MKDKKHIKGLGIPYMGSKRKLASKIVDKILEDNPGTKYFFDLFGGGGAISFEAVQREGIEVTYNEYDKSITELLKKIKRDGITEEFYKWTSRKQFHKMKKNKDWKGGLIKTCWSFGNNVEKGYMYGKAICDKKKELHYQIINNSTMKNINEVRLKKCKEYNMLLESMIRLQHLESLQQLEKLKNYINFNISNLSYEEVKITTQVEETVIYLDPPYESTEKYQNNINHNEFYDWVRQQPYTIYISGYEAPADFEVVMEMEHSSLLNSTANNKVVEKLFEHKGKYNGN